MNWKTLVVIPLIYSLLASCAKANETPSIEGEVLTAVAQTLTAIPPAQELTSTPNPTITIAQYASPTMFSTQPIFPQVADDSCDDSVFTGYETYEDYVVIEPGVEFTKMWEFQNAGSCSWSSTYKLSFYSGSKLEGTTTAIGSAVDPGGTIQVSVDMVSPTTSGTYTGYWQLVNDDGEYFGQIVNVTIVVSTTATPTITPTSTITTTPTLTTIPTIIYIIVTETPTPTTTPTDIETTETSTPGG